MKRFECTFIKKNESKIIGMTSEVIQLVRQDYITDKDEIAVVTPTGYVLFQIVEFMDPIKQIKDDKKTLSENNS